MPTIFGSKHRVFLVTAMCCGQIVCQTPTRAEEVPLEEIKVIGVTPSSGLGLPEDKIPYNVQSASAEEFEQSQSLDLTDLMRRHFASLVINEAQNNPLQNDVQYRGFTASPLLGLPMGMTVYQNGVRVNEVLGDTVNWDLIPEAAIANVDLVGGANPIFGLNTLGGAISITTKNGFGHAGHSLEAYGGSFGRFVTTAESGANNGRWGYFSTLSHFAENGWRDASESEAFTFMATLSFRNAQKTSLDLDITLADTNLIGNGPLPAELLAVDRSAVFTSPDITENQMAFLSLHGDHLLNEATQLSGNVYVRRNDVASFNADASEFEACADGNLYAQSDIRDRNDNGECDVGEFTLTDAIQDQNDSPIVATVNGVERNAINNISRRDQESIGATIQGTFLSDLFGRQNHLVVGGTYGRGRAEFFSKVEIASLNPDRSSAETGLFVPVDGTFLDTRARSWSMYVTNTNTVNERLDVTLSARYNNTVIALTDRGGESQFTEPTPELSGQHGFRRVNPAVGITFALGKSWSAYASYSQSSRAPTPIELACADPDAPCNLPNSFLADPPLEQVVADSFEGGLRANVARDAGANTRLHIGGFHTTNTDDIIFISTGGVSANEGFFANVGDTRRRGVELSLSGAYKRLDWFMNYSYVAATFESSFTASSPNNPNATIDTNDDGTPDAISVRPGDRIPGVPDHSLKLGGTYSFGSSLSIGANLVYNAGVYLRGDEANLLGRTDDYVLVDLTGRYRLTDRVDIFARVGNLFDKDYESFGVLGEPGEAPGLEGFTDSRFLSPGTPLSAFVGVKLTL